MENGNSPFRMIAKTIGGLEEVLAGELNSLGASGVRVINRGVEFTGDRKLLNMDNYRCRTALRILKPIAVFTAMNEQELYQEIKKIDWSEYLDVKGTFSVDGVTSYSTITHSKYMALKTKDAIADQFRDKFGKRPNVNLDKPDLAVNVRLFRNECTVSIDSSGDSLHKRGYRVATGPAPLSEVLAAGMVLLSGYSGKGNFIDPMCGSGTIPIEAGLIACRIPPGFFRSEYSFKHWNDFDAMLWDEVKNEADAIRTDQVDGQIIGSDWSGRIIQTARENVKAAGLECVVTLRPGFMADIEPPAEGGILVTNPPYGERIKTDDIIKLYKEIGDALKKNFTGYSAWIISSHMDALKHVGLRPSRNLKLFNGPLECRYARFEMYEGAKRDQPRDNLPGMKRTPGETVRNIRKNDNPGARDWKNKEKKDFRRKKEFSGNPERGNKPGNNKRSKKDFRLKKEDQHGTISKPGTKPDRRSGRYSSGKSKKNE